MNGKISPSMKQRIKKRNSTMKHFPRLPIKFAAAISTVVIWAMSLNVQADQRIQDDLIVTGSICVGFDCSNGETFNFDTLRLKENNLRIKFIDTSSSSSFPTIDWEIVVNDSVNGGLNKFSIAEVDSGNTPFTILQSAPNHSIYVTATGNVGMGTSTPLVEQHIQDGNSPAIRLHQDGTSGFAEQIWDVSGNETNFFIRDVSNNGALPFRISPGAPNSSIHVAADGDVGFETSTPDGQFDVAHVSDPNNHAFLISPASYVGVNIDNGFVPLGIFDVQTTGGVSRLTVQADGDVGIGTATPVGRFEVKNLANDKSFFGVDAEGDIGIGTNTITDRMEIKNREATATLLNLSNTGQLGLNTNTFVTHGGVVPLFVMQGSSGTDHNSIVLNSPNNLSSSFVFAKADISNWMISSRNDSTNDLNGLYFYDKDFYHVLTLAQGGAIGMGVEIPASGRTIDTVSGAYLTTTGVWTDFSSREAKQDIENISFEEAQDALEQLNPVTFAYKKEPNESHAGFIAEDVPEMVATYDRKGLAAMDITAVLTRVVQEQQKKINELERDIKALSTSKGK